MADYTVTVQDQTIVVEPFGASAIAPLVGLATQAVADANDAATLSGLYANANTDADIPGAAPGERGAKYFAETAGLAVAAVRVPFGVEIYNGGSAILEGIYNGDYNAAANYTINR
ncbi:MAG: hypothetical protein B7Y36_18725, partial [Novosphingobium sp. 28-62-57]|uniref:hypothetical protein n=1 Tax=Novosphingobium sp. 28-62-57 TaxID=1970409 RepID=UPI000BC75E3B